MNRQLNQMSGGRTPDFTPKQGQYLAFIDAYARLHRRPPAEADSNGTSASPRLRSTR
jgi:hypothetical protein